MSRYVWRFMKILEYVCEVDVDDDIDDVIII